MKNNSNNKKPHFSYLKIKHPFLGKSDLLFLKSLKIIVLKSEWFRLHSRYSFFFFFQTVMNFITTTLYNVDLWEACCQNKSSASVALSWKPAPLNLVLRPWGPSRPPLFSLQAARWKGSLKQPIHSVGRNGTPDLILVIPVPHSSWNLNADFIAAAVLGQKKD